MKSALDARYSALINQAAHQLGAELAATLDTQVVNELSRHWADDAAQSGDAQSLAGYLLQWRKRAITNATISLIAGFGTLGVAAYMPPVPRLLTSFASLAFYDLAVRQRKSAQEILPVASGLARIQAAKSAQSLAMLWEKHQQAAPMMPPLLEEKKEEPKLQFFDWQQFETKPDKYAHLAIVGGTGDGKSYLTRQLGAKVFTGKTIVCAPHWEPGDWEGFPVYSKGRDYGTAEDEPVDFEDIIEGIAGKISAACLVKSAYEEMDRRYKLFELGIKDYPMINLVLDELLATLSEVPELAKPLKKLWREARKVRIRIISLIQDDSVEALHIKGEGLVRKNLKYVRLGEFAPAHAKKLNEPQLVEWVSKQEYPILVDGVPAILP
ncbi:MAG: hypothetical protein KME19_08950 [Microcoleus vaginatus WJT46-NPBG5]|jgi:DNA segregation ATPase FtsK/SpoIIIE-like protein|nr:hypothetical protein [Microcoleus vaginatus WJT46-NPBG5]MBW4680228.1 hypothetical protein [Microcoleus vaginatus WJT46-NPBG5]